MLYTKVINMQYSEEKEEWTCNNMSESQNSYDEARQEKSACRVIPFIENKSPL